MAIPQPGILAIGTQAHYHLEFDLLADDSPGTDDTLATLAAGLRRLREPAVTSGGLNLVVGFGPDVWRRLAPQHAPESLRAFAPVSGADGRSAPATQHDVWVWLHAGSPDVTWSGARLVTVALAPAVRLVAEQPCFVYRDSRDLTGFIDGTENPPVDSAPGVGFVPSGEVGEGGSFVITMRWVHDLDAFGALGVPEQEGVIGRRKWDSAELPDDEKPATAHIARVVIEDDGEELEIYRRSTPYGTVGEHGLYFVAFSADVSRYDRMLARMFGATSDGLHDRLMDFSRAVSGAYYFAPSLEVLGAL